MNKSKTILLSTVTASLIFTGTFLSVEKLEAKEKIYDLNVYTYSTRATFNWFTDGLYLGEVQYGETDNYGHKIASDKISDWQSYEITGLKPGTNYYYKIVAKDKKGKTMAELTGQLTTSGQQPNLQVYKNFIYVNFNFDKPFYSHNNQYPQEIYNPTGLKIVEPSIWQGALQVKNKNSHLIYNCEPMFNAGYGTVMAWVRLTSFDKKMMIWQTDDSRYALYFAPKSNRGQIVARAGFNENKIVGAGLDLSKDEEVVYSFPLTGRNKNVWLVGEWHLIAMTWQGKLSGTVKLYVDGEKRAETSYTHGASCATFMLGNNYRHNMNWSEGQIDDFKLFDWNMDSTAMRNEYRAYVINYRKDLVKNGAQVAGYQVRYFKDGKLLKAPDYKIYVISQGKRIHIVDLDALKRFGKHPIIPVSWHEINQYADGGEFYVSSRYSHGTLLKAYGRPAVYWLSNGVLHPILNEQVFDKYGNEWQDIVEVTQVEIDTYPTGAMSR